MEKGTDTKNEKQDIRWTKKFLKLKDANIIELQFKQLAYDC